MGYSDTEPYGARDVRTPNLNRLAQEGVRLTNAYASAPVCAPSRAALLTGRYQQRFGLETNPGPTQIDGPGIPRSERTLAELLKNADYATSMTGKWHLGFDSQYHPNARGFDESLAFYSWSIDYFSHRAPFGRPGLYDGKQPIQVNGYSTDVFTDRAVSFIQRNKSRPFLAYVAYNATLPPHQSPHKREDVRATSSEPVPMNLWHRTTLRDYLDTIEALDGGIGRILDALDETRIAQDTIVIFTCDHGGTGPVRHTPLSQGFRTLGEGGIRVPFLVRWPGVLPAGRVSGQQSILMDVVATTLAASGVSPTRPLDGIDLAPILRGDRPIRERVFCWRLDKVRAVRKGRWKYREEEGESLFDLESDVSEKNDVASLQPEVVRELRTLLGKWEDTVRPSGAQ
jgi:arylsulfatase A-like enzyme